MRDSIGHREIWHSHRHLGQLQPGHTVGRCIQHGGGVGHWSALLQTAELKYIAK